MGDSGGDATVHSGEVPDESVDVADRQVAALSSKAHRALATSVVAELCRGEDERLLVEVW